MKVIETEAYVSVLRELTEEGREVNIRVAGNSMLPFLVHERDYVYFKEPDRELRAGDIVFYQRKNGQYVMHRIWKVKDGQFYMVGDAQVYIEGPLEREQIFALVTKVVRKGRELKPGSFWWEFFEHIWIKIVPLRRRIIRAYGKIGRIKR